MDKQFIRTVLQPGTGNDRQPPPSASSPPDKELMPNAGLPSTIHAVDIISPTNGQQVPIGEDFTIIGASIANATSNCKIIIGLNIKPYQSATGTGHGGAKDYSKWSFTLTPKYAAIKQGPDNKVTARYKCSSGNNNPSILLINSVNVTGMTTTTTANLLQQQRQQQSPTIVNNAATNPQGTGIPWLP